MSRRNNLDRCDVCRMHASLCICALVPRFETRTRLVLLVHVREARKPTNTGQLAARCIARSTIGIVGDRARPLELPRVEDGELPMLLYPGDDAVPLTRDATKRIVLIVPDGNWRQASKMRRRIDGLASVPCVTLPDAGATQYRLRIERRDGGLATFEAIARAMGILEGAEIEAAMMTVFRIMVERTLWLRGVLRDDEVTGGIPAAAIARDPRGTEASRE